MGCMQARRLRRWIPLGVGILLKTVSFTLFLFPLVLLPHLLLTLGICLWFTGFITVGGEWFLMWQSETWNGQQAAFRLVVILGIVLLYLIQPDGRENI